MDVKLIKEAVKQLQLLTIKLHSTVLERDDNYFASNDNLDREYEGLNRGRSLLLEGEDSDGNAIRILRVLVTLGVRLQENARSGGTDPEVKKTLVKIEATFRADYVLKGEVRNEALSEFSKFNALHNIWPFWREHVFQTISRADLPEIPIGLYSGTSAIDSE